MCWARSMLRRLYRPVRTCIRPVGASPAREVGTLWFRVLGPTSVAVDGHEVVPGAVGGGRATGTSAGQPPAGSRARGPASAARTSRLAPCTTTSTACCGFQSRRAIASPPAHARGPRAGQCGVRTARWTGASAGSGRTVEAASGTATVGAVVVSGRSAATSRSDCLARIRPEGVGTPRLVPDEISLSVAQGADRAPVSRSAGKLPREECPRGDLNPHALSGTSTSS
jgi:hypothetical protein